MVEFLQTLQRIGPEPAGALAVIGLLYGLLGWRMIRLLTALNAVAVGVWLACLLPGPAWLARTAALLVGGGLGWLSWRYCRIAAAVMTAVLAFTVSRLLVEGLGLPVAVTFVAAAVVALLTAAVTLTFFTQTAAVMTGIQGGWLVATAVLLAWTVSGEAMLPVALDIGAGPMLVLMWAPICAILVSIQWTDLRQAGSA